jgi:LPXTG-motif cell wall-anchored protein
MMLTKFARPLLLASAAVVLVEAAYAQVQTTTTEQHGVGTAQVIIERGEVVIVSGNDLMVKMEDGTLRHFPNVPESARVNVDGKMLGVHDLKPGMKIQRTTVTTTTPKTVTTVQTVSGKVWYIAAPNTVILTLEDNTNQQFSIPKGQKFSVDGQMVDAFALKKGMNVSATKIVEVPVTVVSEQKRLTGKMPAPVATIPSDQPILIASGAPKPVPATPAAGASAAAAPAPAKSASTSSASSGEQAPTKLPKTGSNLPVLALLGFASLSLALVSRIIRSRA